MGIKGCTKYLGGVRIIDGAGGFDTQWHRGKMYIFGLYDKQRRREQSHSKH